MKLIFVHGRAQAKKNPENLKKIWIESLKVGLRKSGLDLPISEKDIIFPYYGDLLDQLIIDYNRPVEGVITKGSQSNFSDARFFNDFLVEVALNSDVSINGIEEENANNVKEKGPLNWEWIHCILKAIDRKSYWSEMSLKKFTYDVFLYLTISVIKEEVQNKIFTDLGNEPFVLVSHSLGSIVSYDILRERPELKTKKFITLGSPLGITAVKKHLKNPIKMPECIEMGWYNAYDERDVVALKSLDDKHFNINPAIKNSNHVRNHTSNRHGIEGYLDDQQVAKEIYDSLK